MDDPAIADTEFAQFRALMRRVAGIELPSTKKHLVSGRLAKRVRACGLDSFGAYFELVAAGRAPEEFALMLDLLTTHETYFFREPAHFEWLARDCVASTAALRGARGLRVWSAAASSGEEAYSIAMVLADRLGLAAGWEVLGTDISAVVIERARAAVYGTQRLDSLPDEYLKRYCLRGVGRAEGTIRIGPEVRRHVRFELANLNADAGLPGEFDIVFLRNVLIYFDAPTKRAIVERVARRIRPGGWLVIGHSESLNGAAGPLRQQAPTLYRVPDAGRSDT